MRNVYGARSSGEIMTAGDAALGRLSGFYIGFGNFGLNLGFTILETCRDFRLNIDRFVRHIQIFDFYPGAHFIELRRRRGFEPIIEGSGGSTVDAEAARLSKCLTYRQLADPAELPYNIAAGVGSYWPLSAYHARRNFPRICTELGESLEKEAGRRITDFNVFIYAASSGGGTGNGSAPEFASQFIKELERKEKLYTPHVLHMGVTVLPFKTDPRIGLAESNTLTFLGRFSNIVKTIFIGDNQYIQIVKKVNQEDAERMLNELLAWSILGLFFMNYVHTGRYETADYVAFFSTEGRSTWVVPAFTRFKGEELIGYLERWKPEVPAKWIAYQLKDSLAAEINTKYEVRKLLTILALPRTLSVSGDFDHALRKALSEEFNVSEKSVHVAYAHVDVGGLAYAFAYVVDPFIQRIKEIYSSNTHLVKASSSRRRSLENLAIRMRGTMPTGLESYEADLVSREVDYVEEAFTKFSKIFENYLANWGLTPERIGENPHGTNPFLDLLPKFSEPIVRPWQAHRIRLEVVHVEGAKPVNIIDIAVLLNSSHNFTIENYLLAEYADRTISETLETVHSVLNKESDRPLLCLKLGGAYVPLTVDFLRYSMGELNSIPDLTISLVYFGSKRKVKGKSASRSFGKAT
jgi:hypothetical protein